MKKLISFLLGSVFTALVSCQAGYDNKPDLNADSIKGVDSVNQSFPKGDMK